VGATDFLAFLRRKNSHIKVSTSIKPNKPPTTAPAIAPIDDPEFFDGRFLLLGAIVGKLVNDDQGEEDDEDAGKRGSLD
jgi:hypothetical protein